MITNNVRAVLKLNINGKEQQLTVAPMTRLLDVIREDLLLTGSKEGCGEGECGACSVLIDGRVVNSCLVPVAAVVGSSITTIEGMTDRTAMVVKKSFADCNGAQCGICTPGMIISAACLLTKNPTPTTNEITEELSGNLCRCTGYTRIIEAVHLAAQKLRGN